MQRFVNWISRAMIGLAGVGILAMLVLVVADVLGRAVFNVAIPGIDTIVASYLMVATIFLPLGLLQLLDENIAVDILRDQVPDAVKDVFDIVGHLLAVGFYVLLGWLYFKVAVEAFEIKEYVTGTWNVPIWPARILMPLGLFVAALAALAKLEQAVRALVSGSKAATHDYSEPV
ncbi:TRAP transporter small permease [Celeribacter neptunius]|uniref:TRAP transporter small permease protein n=1 Tax=Celeribacter neptunius TaxID=588602 RepID=A0A1I3S8Y9_9RHOB|nr:TRAP transporter small permease [Celeribacter neptunius]SFJ54011.1 TRAP-type mannitol/chloroaromatic compound transport system, small permease component [Celeribacter neptunius]